MIIHFFFCFWRGGKSGIDGIQVKRNIEYEYWVEPDNKKKKHREHRYSGVPSTTTHRRLKFTFAPFTFEYLLTV